MYTVSSTHLRRTLLLLALGTAAQRAAGQDPVRLPAMVTKEAPLPPGPRTIAGVVRDTFAIPIDSAEVSIPSLQRRLFSGADGKFRIENVKPGTYQVRARRIGFAPQIREIVVDTAGGIGEFELVRMATVLPAAVTSVARGGLSGVVGDTAFDVVRGADVAILGHALSTVTDSNGRFFIPVGPGSQMVRISRTGYADRLVSVTIPPDSGRHISVALWPARPIPVREHWNVADFTSRLSWRKRSESAFYTHDDMTALKFEWLADVVAMGVGSSAAGHKTQPPDRDCAVVVDGGPATANLAMLTIDDVEAVEVYPFGAPVIGAPLRRGSALARKGVAMPAGAQSSNASRAAFLNSGRPCPIVYVWTR